MIGFSNGARACLLALLFVGASAGARGYEDAFAAGEKHWLASEHSNSVTAFREALAARPDDPLAAALLCRGLFEIGELLPTDAKKARLALYDEMIRLSENGLKKNPRSGELYFMRALGNGRKATTKGILASLGAAKGMERDWLKALEVGIAYKAPNGEAALADTYHSLGLFYRLMPESSFLKFLVGSSGDMEKAMDYSRKAVAIQTEQIEMVLELGVVLTAAGLERKNQALVREGKEWLEKVATLPVRKKTDVIDVGHAKMLLAHPDLCRDYDREGQHERDLKKAGIKEK